MSEPQREFALESIRVGVTGRNLNGAYRDASGIIFVFSHGYFCGSVAERPDGLWMALMPLSFVGLNRLAPLGDVLASDCPSWQRACLKLIHRHERPLAEAVAIVRAANL